MVDLVLEREQVGIFYDKPSHPERIIVSHLPYDGYKSYHKERTHPG